MRAILIAETPRSVDAEGRGGAVTPLASLIDRPFLQHVIEAVFESGVREIDLVVSSASAVIAGLLGDGTRWGGAIRYHRADLPAKPWAGLRTVPQREGIGPVLIGRVESLPEFAGEDLRRSPRTLYFSSGTSVSWTRWAVLQEDDLPSVPTELGEEELFSFLLSFREGVELVEVARPLTMNSYEDLLESHERVLAKHRSDLLLTGREVSPGIWISRNVALHPTATLVAPVYVGENSRINENAQLGPGAAIGRDCIIDRHTRVVHSVVSEGTYVGEGLKLEHVYAEPERLVNTKLGTEVEGVDDLLLGRVRAHPGLYLKRAVEWMIAALLFVLTLPLLPILLRRSPSRIKDAVRTPTVSCPARWRTFAFSGVEPEEGEAAELMRHLLFSLVPSLKDVLRGRIHFVGVRPRTRDEVELLTNRERALYLRSPLGIVSFDLLTTPQDHAIAQGAANRDLLAAEEQRFGTLHAIGSYLARLGGFDPQRKEREPEPSVRGAK
jgi:mannose-1-phosphate guanylyltransferase